MTMIDLSDSSEEEDMSRFREAVDVSFTRTLRGPGQTHVVEQTSKSERYLDEATHYSDVKVPATLQHQIGARVSAIISKNIEFVDVITKKQKTKEAKGGVKLFKDSSKYLCCNDTEDMSTKLHNLHSRKVDKHRRLKHQQGMKITSDKLQSIIVDGDYILSGKETKFYKSRRKAKVFSYKHNNSNNSFTLVDSN